VQPLNGRTAWPAMLEALILSMVAALIATTISESQLFRDLRLWAKNRSHFLGAGIGCGYCLSHWVAMALVAIYRPRVLLSSLALLDYVLTAFFIAWLAALQWALLMAILKFGGKELSEK
jgi:hypothetical protein